MLAQADNAIPQLYTTSAEKSFIRLFTATISLCYNNGRSIIKISHKNR